jgi:hypothetical protein
MRPPKSKNRSLKPLLPWLAGVALFPGAAHASGQPHGIQRIQLAHDQGYLRIEVLDDDLLHLAYGSGAGPDPAQPIATSPMVFKSDYAGPGQFTRGERSLETAQLRLAVDVHGCATIEERTGGRKLTTICPNDLAQAQKGLSFARGWAAQTATG